MEADGWNTMIEASCRIPLYVSCGSWIADLNYEVMEYCFRLGP
jgi:hypothetical protein